MENNQPAVTCSLSMKCHFRAAWPETIIHKTTLKLRITYNIQTRCVLQIPALTLTWRCRFCILCKCIKTERSRVIFRVYKIVTSRCNKLADRILTNGGLIINQKFKHKKPTLWHISDANCIFKNGTFKSHTTCTQADKRLSLELYI